MTNKKDKASLRKDTLGYSNFSPLLFLASTGAGGISVGAFVLIQYTIYAGKGLAILDKVPQNLLTISLEAIMIIFSLIHIVLSLWFFAKYFSWKKSGLYESFRNNPLVNSGLMAAVLSVAMTFNVVIADFRYFLKPLSDNFQAIMLPAFVAYLALWFWTVAKSIALLKTSFTESFDVDKIHFGWLLNPFALAMTTVTGTGFAALAHNTATITYNTDIAKAALFLTLVSGTMALFLTFVKMFSIFKKHLHREGTLENHFMPTYLIIIPILTVFGISVFRLGHFAEKHFGDSGETIFAVAKITLLLFFAFQTWYFAFGLAMIKDYWKGYLKDNFHVSQWGLVCPFVAYSVLGGFVYKIFFANNIFLGILLAILAFTVILFFFLFKRQLSCLFSNGENKICDK